MNKTWIWILVIIILIIIGIGIYLSVSGSKLSGGENESVQEPPTLIDEGSRIVEVNESEEIPSLPKEEANISEG